MVTSAQDPVQLIVNVYVDELAGDKVTCNPNPLLVPRNLQYVVLTFNVITERWYFPGNGAVVLTAASLQFPLASWTEPNPEHVPYGRVAKIFDFNGDSFEYHYDITLERLPNSDENDVVRSVTLRVDPMIQNGY